MLTVNNPRTFDWAGMSLSDCCEGNAADTYFTLKLFNLIEEKIKDLGMEKVVSQLVMPSLSTFSKMEYEGMEVSEEDELYTFKEVDTSSNLSSNSDLIEILYTNEDGFQLYPPDRTTKGAPSVSAPTLKLLLGQIEEELDSRG